MLPTRNSVDSYWYCTKINGNVKCKFTEWWNAWGWKEPLELTSSLSAPAGPPRASCPLLCPLTAALKWTNSWVTALCNYREWTTALPENHCKVSVGAAGSALAHTASAPRIRNGRFLVSGGDSRALMGCVCFWMQMKTVTPWLVRLIH